MYGKGKFVTYVAVLMTSFFRLEVQCKCVTVDQFVSCDQIDQSELDELFENQPDPSEAYEDLYLDLITLFVTKSTNVHRLTRRVFFTKNEQIVRIEFIKFSKTGLKDIGKALIDQQMSLKVLEISYSELTNLPRSDRPFKKFRTMNLFGNDIKVIKEDAFGMFQELRKVNLSHNSIYHIESGAFSSLPHLQELDLSHNDLTVINNNAFRMSPRLSPGTLIVDLSNNKIMMVQTDSFPSPLLKLDLSENHLQSFPESKFKKLLDSMLPYVDSVIYFAGSRNKAEICKENWMYANSSFMCKVVQDPRSNERVEACLNGIKHCKNFCDEPYYAYQYCDFYLQDNDVY